MNFSNYFLCGLDFDFLMLDALVVTFIDIVAGADASVRARLMLGVLIAYILDSILIFLRSYFGRRNLARHTLADERFLI
jgi:Meckelin (Transmembrane protein 67)